jgi:predicted  nucleic acid-binding Zn-ribbon protein
MGNPVRALLSLQEVDKDLYRVNAELKRLPEDQARRLATLENVKEVLAERRTTLKGTQVKIKELEDVVTVQQQRIRKLDKESTSNTDVTVIEACRYEIRGLKRQIEEAEREQFSMMESIERGKMEIEKIEGRLESELSTFEVFCQNVETEMSQARERQEELQGKRVERLGDSLDANTLDLYDRLLAARGGEALARLDGGVCQCCYMQVPPNIAVQLARSTKVIQCSSCDRIMYL